jgi:hypothetical protein
MTDGKYLPDETEKIDPDEAILREMKAVTDRLANDKLSSRDTFGALVEHGDTPTWRSVKAKRQRKKVLSPPLTPVVGKADQTKPVLKRRTATLPKPGKSVKITDEAMILPSGNAPIETKPHNPHVFAETRHRQAFYRRGTWNKPGPWVPTWIRKDQHQPPKYRLDYL